MDSAETATVRRITFVGVRYSSCQLKFPRREQADCDELRGNSVALVAILVGEVHAMWCEDRRLCSSI